MMSAIIPKRIARFRTALWVCSVAMGWIMAAAGCGSRQKVVRIAVALPLTGDLASEGQGLRRAVILAVEQANARGDCPSESRSPLLTTEPIRSRHTMWPI